MSEETITEVEVLDSVGVTIDTTANHLGRNRIDRSTFRKYLCDYSNLAASDRQLLKAARHNFRCANRALFLAEAHKELSEENRSQTPPAITWSFVANVPSKKPTTAYQEDSRSSIYDLDDANVIPPPT
ncbi:Pc12g02380 [Penicillium rubens Wisconsin 54-1255]|uniref:Pc12g02380 protein n=1 Tax=Penicillium rubens (strain ATCC 28089 / DSM 1075 / NRRL 1951 / Wisconsin 54-1255) TaxID=500485 RepID=B6GZW1_PENRW|nr:Pc12g02380 [Penicillium rubens Wisconsin 54-1255]